MEAIAKRRNLKGSPQKTRLVIDLIRGRNVSQALAILQYTNKRAAKPVTKLLRSAIANATYQAEQKNVAIDPDDLWVKSCFVDMGMHKNRRRLRPAPQGRAYQEQRHYCHITILVSSEKPESPVVKLKKHGNSVDAEAVALKEANAKSKKSESEKKGKKADKPSTKKTETKKSEEEVIEVEKPVVDIPEPDTTVTKEAKTDVAPENEATDAAPEAEASPAEETVDNKPLAAQTEEEKTGTKKAEEAQIDENEELERQ